MKSQLTFDFEVPRPPENGPGTLRYAPEVRHALSLAIKSSSRTREQIAAEMSLLTGSEITGHMLNAWTAESREAWRFPLEYAAAFEAACQTHTLTELLAAKRGCKVLMGEAVLEAEWGRLEALESEIKARKRELKKRIGGNR